MSRRDSKNLKSQRDSSKCGRRGVVKCPFCGYEAYVNCFKLLREPWRYWFYEVKRLECPSVKMCLGGTRASRQEVNMLCLQ